MKIALLGAESTGKTALAHALAVRWRNAGQTVEVVTEVLREWCAEKGRTPYPIEQQGIAEAQAQRVDAAPPSDWLVADTTPLMVAVYSDLLFDDRSLYALALTHHRQYDLTLLMGLDLPWVADGLQRDGPHVREPVDARVRAALARAGVHFRVIYGSGEARLGNALNAINSVAGHAYLTGPTARKPSQNRAWSCEKCSDPDCEHKLFTGLWASPATDRPAS